MSNQAEIVQKEPKLTQRDIAYSLLRKEGMNNLEATKALGVVPSRGTQIAHKLNKKYNLKEENYLKPAARAIKNILKGKTFGEVKQIKDSTVLAAASMVYDRIDPVIKQSLNVNQTTTFIKIETDRYE